MVQKILGIAFVVLLVGALIGGGAYLLLQDSGSGSGGGRAGQNQAAGNGLGAAGSRGNGGAQEGAVDERGGGYRGGNAATTGSGTGTPAAAVAPEEWLTVSGVVVAMENDLVVRAADGTEFTFSLGPSWYGESSGVAIQVGDDVRVTGFYEDGELMAGTVENLSSGQALVLRNESGQPLWSGRGRHGQ
jgi:hypothetical protein